jgi:hypothetical protein
VAVEVDAIVHSRHQSCAAGHVNHPHRGCRYGRPGERWIGAELLSTRIEYHWQHVPRPRPPSLASMCFGIPTPIPSRPWTTWLRR